MGVKFFFTSFYPLTPSKQYKHFETRAWQRLVKTWFFSYVLSIPPECPTHGQKYIQMKKKNKPSVCTSKVHLNIFWHINHTLTLRDSGNILYFNLSVEMEYNLFWNFHILNVLGSHTLELCTFEPQDLDLLQTLWDSTQAAKTINDRQTKRGHSIALINVYSKNYSIFTLHIG